MSEEAQFQQRIIDLCGYLNVKVMHINDSRRQHATGYPDLTLAGPGGVIFAELKSRKGKVTTKQQEWLETLTASGQEAVVWRPEDWDHVQSEIKRIARR